MRTNVILCESLVHETLDKESSNTLRFRVD